jgi:pyrroline-5-carboxylate reductase
MKVMIMGFGNMGKTYANGFISSRFIKQDDIYVLSRNEVTNDGEFGIPRSNFFTNPTLIISELDIIILSVKPQDFAALAQTVQPFLNQNQLVLSVMAGVTINRIKEELKVYKIIRSMPNIPTQIGMGMTVFSASSEVDRKELFIVQNLINTTGKSVYVEKEELLNAATAISGSGPAYVFYFMDAMIQAAVELGFNESEAELLVNQTFMGSVAIQNSYSLSNEEWIKKVASKGGTTESALLIFQDTQVNEAIVKAMHAANARAIELGSYTHQK